jgi:hypothetical protein
MAMAYSWRAFSFARPIYGAVARMTLGFFLG